MKVEIEKVVEDMHNEEWQIIPNTDEYYEVSNMGRVRSWKNNRYGRKKNQEY